MGLRQRIVMVVMGLLLVSGHGSSAQDRQERRQRSVDGTRDAVELRAAKSQKYVEKLLAHNKEIQDAADLLRLKGYRPQGVYVVYTERTGKGVPKDHVEGEVVVWSWEDYDANVATGIVYARNSQSGNSEVNAVQVEVSTGETQWRWVAQRDGKGHRSDMFQGPVKVLPAGDRFLGRAGVVRVQNYKSYYSCASWGCGAAAVVSFLIGPEAFVGGCTAAMLACLQNL